MSQEEIPSLSELPLGDLVSMLEKFILNNIQSDAIISDVIKRQAKGFLRLLSAKIENLTNGQRRGKTEEIRDRIVIIAQKLTEISGNYSQAVKNDLDIFTGRALSFLGNYGFSKCESIDDLAEYLDIDEHKTESWNSIKFNAFLVHLKGLSDFDARKSEFLITFLNTDTIKSCNWTEENFVFIAFIIKRTKNRAKKAELKRQFNSIPGVQKDRREGNKDDTTDPWNTLYYESKMNGKEEAFGYSNSGLGRLSGKMGVIAAKGQPPK